MPGFLRLPEHGLLLSGLALAPALGRHLDQHGTGQAMSVGAVICALGLALLAMARGPVSYLATWFVIGVGHAMQLANTGNVTVAQLMGEQTRRAIGLTMLASSVFWPLTAWLCAAYGWRACWFVFAAMRLLVVLPIHLSIPAYRARPPAEAPPPSGWWRSASRRAGSSPGACRCM